MDTQVPTVNPYSTGTDVSGVDHSQLFPVVDPQFKPFGNKVLVQLRRVVTKSRGGILLTEGTTDTEAWNIQVGKLIAVGPLAFKRRDTGEPWPEGVWAALGDFVRVPRWGGDRLSIDLKDDGKPVVVLVMNDSDLLGAYTGDPAEVRSFIQ